MSFIRHIADRAVEALVDADRAQAQCDPRSFWNTCVRNADVCASGWAQQLYYQDSTCNIRPIDKWRCCL